MRLIDADALKEALTEHFNTGRYNNHTVLGYIDAAPTVGREVLPLGNMTNTPEAIQEHIRKSMPNVSKELVALMTSPSIQECVNRFLSWKLPSDFAPDCGIEFNADKYANNKFEPTGTNLFTADQAKEMIKHILAGAHVELNAPTVQREGWVSVEDRLPDDGKCVLAIVLDKDNAKGWHWQIVNYGHYDFYTFDDDHPNADEEGLVSRTGWHYGRESEGEFDYLIFELDGKVTHWQPIPAAPKE